MAKINYEKKLNRVKVLVTGATSGLGFSTAIALAREGAEVIAVGRDKMGLEFLSDEIKKLKGTVSLVSIDLANQGTIEELSQKLAQKFGNLNIVIHCAMSSLPMMPINQISINEIERNLLSPIMICFRLISCFHSLLIGDEKGLFIYVSDRQKTKFNGPYNSAKRACDQLFKTYLEENKRFGLNVHIQYPGPMNTKLRKKLFPGDNKNDENVLHKEAQKIIDKILELT